MFICGSRSFGHEREDKNGRSISSSSTRKESKRSKSLRGAKSKNPYADGGLDKFFALLADHDEKKQRIYDEMGSEDISFIRFVYSDDSQQAKPIIVRSAPKKKSSMDSKIFLVPPHKSLDHGSAAAVIISEDKKVAEKRDEREVLSKREKWRVQPYHYFLPAMMLLILLFLAIVGRSMAILCTSMAWYLVPSKIVHGGVHHYYDHTSGSFSKRTYSIMRR